MKEAAAHGPLSDDGRSANAAGGTSIRQCPRCYLHARHWAVRSWSLEVSPETWIIDEWLPRVGRVPEARVHLDTAPRPVPTYMRLRLRVRQGIYRMLGLLILVAKRSK